MHRASPPPPATGFHSRPTVQCFRTSRAVAPCVCQGFGGSESSLPSSRPSHPSLPETEKNNIMVLDRNEFRRGVGLCVMNKHGLVFAARRVDDRTRTWQMPQGGIDRLENPLVAALRELREETGITSVRFVASIDSWLDYEFPTKVRADSHAHDGSMWFRYRGQTQKWLLMEFTGVDEEIDLSCHGTPEFSEWRWMPLEELPSNVVHFKKDVYEAVARHFGPRIAAVYKERWRGASELTHA